MTAPAIDSPPRGEVLRNAEGHPTLQLAVFLTSAEVLRHYAKWACGADPNERVVVEACLLDQDLDCRDEIIGELTRLGFDPSRIHVLEDDGVRDPDVYVDPYQGGIGAHGAFAVPDLGDKGLYLFDNIPVTEGDKPAKDKLYKLMRLMAGIPKDGGYAILFDGEADRICFSQHCISTLKGRQRDMVIREALDDLRA